MSSTPKYTTYRIDRAEAARRRRAAEERRRQEEALARRARLVREAAERRDGLRQRLDDLAKDLERSRPVAVRVEELRKELRLIEVPPSPADADLMQVRSRLDAFAPHVDKCIADADAAQARRREEEARRVGQVSELLASVTNRLAALEPARRLDGQGRGRVEGALRDAERRQAEGMMSAALDAVRRASAMLAAHEAVVAVRTSEWQRRCAAVLEPLVVVEDKLRTLDEAGDLPAELRAEGRKQLEELVTDRAALLAAPVQSDDLLAQVSGRSGPRVVAADSLLTRADAARVDLDLQADVVAALKQALGARGFSVSPRVESDGVVLSAVREGPTATHEQVDVRVPANATGRLEFVSHGLDPKSSEPACPRTEQELGAVLDELAQRGVPTSELSWEGKGGAAPTEADDNSRKRHPGVVSPKAQERQRPGSR